MFLPSFRRRANRQLYPKFYSGKIFWLFLVLNFLINAIYCLVS